MSGFDYGFDPRNSYFEIKVGSIWFRYAHEESNLSNYLNFVEKEWFSENGIQFYYLSE